MRLVTPEVRPRPVNKRVWASLERTLAEVVGELFDEASRLDPAGDRPWFVLIDGDGKLEAAIRREARSRGVLVHVVLDAIHALQYLWSAGLKLNAEGTPALERWVLERFEKVLNGEAVHVAAGMRRSATKRGLPANVRAPIDAAARYFLKRKNLMRYDTCLATGAPIASGVIEGACRTLINDRLDVTGARRSLGGAEAVMKLRALIQSHDFDDYWEFHIQQDVQRTHASKYQDGTPPPLTSPSKQPALRIVK